MASKRALVPPSAWQQHDLVQLQAADWLFVTHLHDLAIAAPVAPGDTGKYMKFDGAGYVWDTPVSGGTPVAVNKAMPASVTTADYDLACATAIASTPANDGYVMVLLNGVQVEVGNGVRTKQCYFSADGGATARAIADITAGDLLYWVGSVAGHQLAADDWFDFDYSV